MIRRERNGKVFWTGGSQAVRIPKTMRLPGTEVTIKRRGRALLIEPIAEQDNWDGFWDRLVPLQDPVRRWQTRRADKRRPL